MRRIKLWHSNHPNQVRSCIQIPTIAQVTNFKNYSKPKETSIGNTTLFDITKFGSENSYDVHYEYTQGLHCGFEILLYML